MCAMQGQNAISHALRRSMVETDSRILAPFVSVTELGIVCDGKTLDFDTCQDSGDDLKAKVRCKWVLGRVGVFVWSLHLGRGNGE